MGSAPQSVSSVTSWRPGGADSANCFIAAHKLVRSFRRRRRYRCGRGRAPTPGGGRGSGRPKGLSSRRKIATIGTLRYASRPMRVLLVTPPMIQLNTPYPATAYLTGFLREHAVDLGLEVAQADASILLFLRLYSRPLITRMAEVLRSERVPRSRPRKCRRRWRISWRMPIATPTRWSRPSGSCSAETPACRSASWVARGFPKGRASTHTRSTKTCRPRSAVSAPPSRRGISPACMSTISPMCGAVGIDPRFELARYGERLAASAASFDPLREALDAEPTLVDETLDAITRELLDVQPPRRGRHHRTVPRQRVRRFSHGARDSRSCAQVRLDPRRRLGEHRAALAARSARVRLLRLRDARRRRAAAAESAHAAGAVADCRWRAPMCAKATQVVLEHDATQHDFPAARHRHPDLRRAAAGPVRFRAGNAEPHASLLVRRALEQDHAGARLLLEEVFLLRRVAGLHRPLRQAGHRHRHAAHPRADRGDRRDRLSSRR